MWPASLALLLVALALPAHGEAPLLDGSLGRWLDDSAAPQLAELLSRHPRFKGETIAFAPMRNGNALPGGDRLTQAVEQRLTQNLLRRDGIRLSWHHEAARCAPPQKVPYLVGLEIVSHGTREHRLHIAVVDVEEGIWVSGFSLDWTGRLSTAERTALGTGVDSGLEGTADNPLPLDSAPRIGELMVAGLRCALPGGLDGPLYIHTPADPRLASITGAIAQRIALMPLATLTLKRGQAAWVMGLESRPMSAGNRELALTLRHNLSGTAVQRVASVIVVEDNAVAHSPPTDMPGRVSFHGSRPGSVSLLTDLAAHSAEPVGICGGNRRAGDCIEMGFELLRPAYLIVASTQDGRLRSQVCGVGLRLSMPGERRYRLRIPPSGNAGERPDAGLYVLAVEKRNVAHRIARHVNRAPGACSGDGTRKSSATWLRELHELLRLHEQEVDWRVAHLAHTASGIVRI